MLCNCGSHLLTDHQDRYKSSAIEPPENSCSGSEMVHFKGTTFKAVCGCRQPFLLPSNTTILYGKVLLSTSIIIDSDHNVKPWVEGVSSQLLVRSHQPLMMAAFAMTWPITLGDYTIFMFCISDCTVCFIAIIKLIGERQEFWSCTKWLERHS